MDPDAANLTVLTNLAIDAPLAVRVAVGAIGAVVLFWGARIYKPALIGSAFAVGAVGAVGAVQGLALLAPEVASVPVVLIAAALGGVVVAAIASAAHKIALVGIGALLGLAGAGAVLELAPPGMLGWWLLPVGILVGAIALPLLFQTVLKLTTPVIGAVLVAWALARPENAWVLGGLWLAGTLFQLGFVRTPPEPEQQE